MIEEKFNMFFCHIGKEGDMDVDFLAWRGAQKQARRAFKAECEKYDALLWALLKNVSRGDIIVEKIEPKNLK